MVREWLWYLTEPAWSNAICRRAKLLQVTAPLESSSGGASLETPGGRVAQVFGQEEDGRLVFRYAKTQFPGNIASRWPTPPKVPAREISGRPRPRGIESHPASPEQIDGLVRRRRNGVWRRSAFSTAAQKIAAPPKALAMWLLMALIVLMAVEIAVAFWLARRRRAAAPRGCHGTGNSRMTPTPNTETHPEVRPGRAAFGASTDSSGIGGGAGGHRCFAWRDYKAAASRKLLVFLGPAAAGGAGRRAVDAGRAVVGDRGAPVQTQIRRRSGRRQRQHGIGRCEWTAPAARLRWSAAQSIPALATLDTSLAPCARRNRPWAKSGR